VFGVGGDIPHPLADDIAELSNDFLLDIGGFAAIVIILGEDIVEDVQILLIHLRIALRADHLMRVLEFLQVLVRGETVRF
jgi:hypothetical protein